MNPSEFINFSFGVRSVENCIHIIIA